MTLNPSIITTSIPAYFSSQETTAFATGQTMPRKANPSEGDTFQSQKSATLKKAKATKQPADDNKGLLIAAGIGTLIVSLGLLFAWLYSAKKGKPLATGSSHGSGEFVAGNDGIGGTGRIGKILNATELGIELESQLTTIKTNAENWLTQQEQAVADIKNSPLNIAGTEIETYFQGLVEYHFEQASDFEESYRKNANDFEARIKNIKECTREKVYDENALEAPLQARSRAIEQVATKALVELPAFANQHKGIPSNSIIPSAFDSPTLEVNYSDKDIQDVYVYFNLKLTQFYLDFRRKVNEFKQNAIAPNTPDGLIYDLDKQLDQLLEQSEFYKLHKALYESIYPPST